MGMFVVGLFIGIVVVTLMVILFIVGYYLGAMCEVKKLMEIEQEQGADACIEKLYDEF